jgi:hypothetical protein
VASCMSQIERGLSRFCSARKYLTTSRVWQWQPSLPPHSSHSRKAVRLDSRIVKSNLAPLPHDDVGFW